MILQLYMGVSYAHTQSSNLCVTKCMHVSQNLSYICAIKNISIVIRTTNNGYTLNLIFLSHKMKGWSYESAFLLHTEKCVYMCIISRTKTSILGCNKKQPEKFLTSILVQLLNIEPFYRVVYEIDSHTTCFYDAEGVCEKNIIRFFK